MDQAIGTAAGHFGDAPTPPAEESARPVGKAFGAGGEHQDVPPSHVYAGREWSSDHPLNIRVSIPLGVGRYYITLVAGKERRARARLALNRRQHPLATPGNVLFLAFVSAIATIGSITLLYQLLAQIFGWSGRLML